MGVLCSLDEEKRGGHFLLAAEPMYVAQQQQQILVVAINEKCLRVHVRLWLAGFYIHVLSALGAPEQGRVGLGWPLQSSNKFHALEIKKLTCFKPAFFMHRVERAKPRLKEPYTRSVSTAAYCVCKCSVK